MVLGVVAALPAEAMALSGERPAAAAVQELSGGVLLRVCGIGPARAEAAAAELLAHGAVALVSWGIAGGLDPRCRAGDLLLPISIDPADGAPLRCDEPWRRRLGARLGARLRVHQGVQLASAVVVRRPADKRAQGASGRLGVDMESGAVARVAHDAGVPVIAVRAVADPVHLVVPPTALAGMGPDGRPQPLAILAALGRRPQDTLGVLRLWRASAAALRTLRAVAAGAGRRLMLEEHA